MYFVLKQVATGNETRFSSQPGGVPIAPESMSAFRDVFGQYYVRAMEPGKYEFVTWELVMPHAFGAKVWSPKVKPPPLPISLSAGQIVSVGNLHGRLVFRDTMFGAPELQYGVPEILDSSARDLTAIAKTHPQVEGKVTVRLLPTGEWLTP